MTVHACSSACAEVLPKVRTYPPPPALALALPPTLHQLQQQARRVTYVRYRAREARVVHRARHRQLVLGAAVGADVGAEELGGQRAPLVEHCKSRSKGPGQRQQRRTESDLQQ